MFSKFFKWLWGIIAPLPSQPKLPSSNEVHSGISFWKCDRQPVLPILAIFLLTSLGFPTTVNAAISPTDLTGLVLWLDAEDVDGDGNAANNPAEGDNVTTWVDKSGNGANVISGQALGSGNTGSTPTYRLNQFNGKAVLEFIKSEKDALVHNLATPWNGQYTVFVTFKQIGTTAPADFSSFFSNGSLPNSTYFQIHYKDGNFSWISGTTINFAPFDNNLNLYSVRGDSTTTTVYSNGIPQNSATDTTGRQFNQYRININRNGAQPNDSLMAEVILYNRAITDCEMRQVNQYLGEKYGRDFGGAAPGGVNENCSLALWLKADDGPDVTTDGTAINQWDDYSGYDNHATQTGSARPTFENGLTDKLNNKPVVRFDGTDDFLNLGITQFPTGTGARTYIFVTKVGASAGAKSAFHHGNGSNQGIDITFQQTKTAVDVGGHSYGINDGSEEWQITLIDLPANANSDQWDIYYNGGQTTLQTLNSTPQTVNTDTASAFLGKGSSGNFFQGDFAEVIVYNMELSEEQRNKVESYLSLKYATSLAGSLISSDGTIIWNAVTNSANHNDVTCIGLDENGGFDNLTNTSTINTITGTSANITDQEFLCWGHDTGALTASTEVPSGILSRLTREWKVQETGDTGNVAISFDLTTITTIPFDNSTTFQLLIDADGDFSNATVSTATATLTGDIVEFSGVDLSTGQYFSLAYNNDADGDGLPNSTEVAMGLNPNDADTDNDGTNDGDEDTDGDGIPNNTEIAMSLDPNDTDSDDNGTDDGDEDADSDGISNSIEIAMGLDPEDTDSDDNGTNDGDEDTDGDGIPNSTEVSMSLDPNDTDTDDNGTNDGDEDTDGDGIPNSTEVSMSLDPNDTDTDDNGTNDGDEDTDGDGIPNNTELGMGLDPNDIDTDSDGINDGNEDTDGDGIPNNTELGMGLDPNDIDTDDNGTNDGDEDTDGDIAQEEESTIGSNSSSSGLSPLPRAMHIFVEISGSGTVSSDPGGINCKPSHCQKVDSHRDITGLECDPDYCAGEFKTNTEVLLTPTPDEDFVFTGWGGHPDCVGSESESTAKRLLGNRLCIAFFNRIRLLTVLKIGDGELKFYAPYETTCENDTCTAWLSHGMNVFLRALPTEDSGIVTWGEDCSGADQWQQVRMMADKVCTVTFE
jgi:hypothetical protein